MVMDPDDPRYADDEEVGDGVETCHHGVPFSDDCEECEIEEDDLDDYVMKGDDDYPEDEDDGPSPEDEDF